MLVLHVMLAIGLIGPAVTQDAGSLYLGGTLIPAQVRHPARFLGKQLPLRIGSSYGVNRIQIHDQSIETLPILHEGSSVPKSSVNDRNDIPLEWVKCAMGSNMDGLEQFTTDQIIAMRKAAFRGDRFLLCFLFYEGQVFQNQQRRHINQHKLFSAQKQGTRHHRMHHREGKQNKYSKAGPKQHTKIPSIKPMKPPNIKGRGRHHYGRLAMQRKVFSMRHGY